MGSAYQFHSWRVFVLVCAFPSVAAIAALSAMPESPRFYLEVRTCVSHNISSFYAYMWSLIFPHKMRWTYINTPIDYVECDLCLFFPFSLKQNGKHDEGWMILKQVHDTNMRAKGYPERVFSVSTQALILFCTALQALKSLQCVHGSLVDLHSRKSKYRFSGIT